MPKPKHEMLTKGRVLSVAGAALALASLGVREVQLNKADGLGRAQAEADSPAKTETHISATAPHVEYHRVSQKLSANGRLWDVAMNLSPKTHQDVREIADDLETYYPGADVQPNQDVTFYEDASGKVVPNPDNS